MSLILPVLCAAACSGESGSASTFPSTESADLAADTRLSEVSGIGPCARACPEVVREILVTLGTPDDPALLGHNAAVAATADYLVVGNLPERGVLALYSWEGTALGLVGREGAGPGEFLGTRPVIGPGDSVWVVDGRNQRISVLGAEGQIVRTFPLHGTVSSLVPTDRGRVIIEGVLLTDSQASAAGLRRSGSPGLHVLDRTGKLLHSFAPRGAALPDLIASNRANVWKAAMSRPYLEEWSLDGERLRTFERQLDWFEPWNPNNPKARVAGLENGPRVADVAVDSGGNIWVKTFVHSGNRRAGIVNGRTDMNAMARVIDVLIEVIDPNVAQVIAEGRLDSPYTKSLGANLWSTARQDSNGYVTLEIWRGRIAGRGTAPN